MGVTCQRFLNEEESITAIFSSLPLREIPVQRSYEEFQLCMENGALDFFKYFSYVDKIVGNNSNQELHKFFFENLWKEEVNRVQMIGTLIILLSKGSDGEKIGILVKHFHSYYFSKKSNKSNAMENSLKSFLWDFIYTHTYLCYLSFNSHLGNDNMKSYTYIWSENRREKLMYAIYQNYESVKLKYNKRQQSEDYSSLSSKSSEESISSTDYDNIILKEFFKLVDTQLDGDFVREWLHDDYMREKTGSTCF
jgi:hypothetical protein